MKRNIRIERFYPHPPERVFRALTDPAALAEWLMPNDFVPQLGHKFQFRSKPQGNWNGITDCEVIELNPPHSLAITWTGQSRDGSKPALKHTVVRWFLTPEAGGTRLRLEHTGFEGLGEIFVSFIMEMGWKKKILGRLEGIVARREAA